MCQPFIQLTPENLEKEHICCAIADKKHQPGVDAKKIWLRERLKEGHTFRKLDERGKVFIEYAPLETAWVPVLGDGYLYIYCLWVAGSFKGKGYGNALLQSCIRDAKNQGKSGVCIISSKKKKPYLSDRKFLQKYGFEVADTVGDDYELLALSLDGSTPRFTQAAKGQTIDEKDLTVFYSPECPFIPDCLKQIEAFCGASQIPLRLVAVDDLSKAKAVPCVFNNWAVFHNGRFVTTQLLNEGGLKKLLDTL